MLFPALILMLAFAAAGFFAPEGLERLRRWRRRLRRAREDADRMRRRHGDGASAFVERKLSGEADLRVRRHLWRVARCLREDDRRRSKAGAPAAPLAPNADAHT